VKNCKDEDVFFLCVNSEMDAIRKFFLEENPGIAVINLGFDRITPDALYSF
jgi:hypothetical protein